jgi:putative cardiolipin synthase
VHSGYAKRRRDLLKSGVELYEMRRDAAAGSRNGGVEGRDSAGGKGGAGGSRGSGGNGSVGSSDSSLHAKTFAVDAERIFIGSFNFDPRSALHNTELGLVIESPVMASALSRMFLKDIPEASYQVQFDAHRRLEWIERRPDGTTVVYHDEPRASLGRRLAVTLFGLLPIEGLL